MSLELIHISCFLTPPHWMQPTGADVKIMIGLTGLNNVQLSVMLGLSTGGDRTIRKWVSGACNISYASWRLLARIAASVLAQQGKDNDVLFFGGVF